MWWAVAIAALLFSGLGLWATWYFHGLHARTGCNQRRIGIDQAWQAWLSSDHLSREEQSARMVLLGKVDAQVRASVHQSLLEFERALQTETNPMLVVRKELMSSIDRRQLNTEVLKLPEPTRVNLRATSLEIPQTDAEARIYIAANELRMAVLREYSGLCFGDCADGDWFDVYARAAYLRQRSTRNYIERTLNGSQNIAADARFHTMTLVDSEIRARLLQIPAGTRFPGFGKTLAQSDESA